MGLSIGQIYKEATETIARKPSQTTTKPGWVFQSMIDTRDDMSETDLLKLALCAAEQERDAFKAQRDEALEVLEKIATGAYPCSEREAFIFVDIAKKIAEKAIQNCKYPLV